MNELIQPGTEPMPVGIYEKITAVMKKIEYLKASDDIKFNGVKQYSYLSEEKITTNLHDALVEFGLVMFPAKVVTTPVYETKVRFDKYANGPVTETLQVKTIVEVTYKLVDIETGQYEFIMSTGKGADSGDKDTNKAMTGAFKYAQRQAFFIPTGDDPDKISSADLDKALSDGPKTEGAVSTPPPVPPATSGNKDLDAEVEILIMQTKNPKASRILAEAFTGDIGALITILKGRI